MAEAADKEDVPDGMKIPEELSRRRARLEAIARAKAEIEDRAKERHARELEAYEEKMAKRQKKKPRGKVPKPPQKKIKDKDQINLTDKASRVMPVSGGGFEQAYNAQACVDVDSMLIVRDRTGP